MSSSNLDGRPSIAYLGALFELLQKHGVSSYMQDDLHIVCGDLPEEVPEEASSEEPDGLPDYSPVEVPEPPTSRHPYENPVTFGSNRVPPFPQPGDALRDPEE